jgi:hypothetical protein
MLKCMARVVGDTRNAFNVLPGSYAVGFRLAETAEWLVVAGLPGFGSKQVLVLKSL